MRSGAVAISTRAPQAGHDGAVLRTVIHARVGSAVNQDPSTRTRTPSRGHRGIAVPRQKRYGVIRIAGPPPIHVAFACVYHSDNGFNPGVAASRLQARWMPSSPSRTLWP